MGVNQIVKATGGQSKRKGTINFIKELRRNEFIQRANDPRITKQKSQRKIMQLTELGKEYVGLSNHGNALLDSYIELVEQVREYRKKHQQKTLSDLYKTDSDFKDVVGFLKKARFDFGGYFVSTLMARYAGLIYKYKPNPNALRYVNQAILELIFRFFSLRGHHLSAEKLADGIDVDVYNPEDAGVVIDELTFGIRQVDYETAVVSACNGMKPSGSSEIKAMQGLAQKFTNSFISLWEPASQLSRSAGIKEDEYYGRDTSRAD